LGLFRRIGYNGEVQEEEASFSVITKIVNISLKLSGMEGIGMAIYSLRIIMVIISLQAYLENIAGVMSPGAYIPSTQKIHGREQ